MTDFDFFASPMAKHAANSRHHPEASHAWRLIDQYNPVIHISSISAYPVALILKSFQSQSEAYSQA